MCAGAPYATKSLRLAEQDGSRPENVIKNSPGTCVKDVLYKYSTSVAKPSTTVGFSLCFNSVSYTHLDVYKRQNSASLNCTNACVRDC